MDRRNFSIKFGLATVGTSIGTLFFESCREDLFEEMELSLKSQETTVISDYELLEEWEDDGGGNSSHVELDSEQRDRLIRELNELIEEHCLTAATYQSLLDYGAKINFAIDTSLDFNSI